MVHPRVSRCHRCVSLQSNSSRCVSPISLHFIVSGELTLCYYPPDMAASCLEATVNRRAGGKLVLVANLPVYWCKNAKFNIVRSLLLVQSFLYFLAPTSHTTVHYSTVRLHQWFHSEFLGAWSCVERFRS